MFLAEINLANFQPSHINFNFTQKCFPISSEYAKAGYFLQTKNNLISQPKVFARDSICQKASGPYTLEKDVKSFSNGLVCKKNEHLMQQNRILINYKKLRHLEETISKNNSFLKKNFDFLVMQMKTKTESSKFKKRKKNLDNNTTDEADKTSSITTNYPVKQSLKRQKKFRNQEEFIDSKKSLATSNNQLQEDIKITKPLDVVPVLNTHRKTKVQINLNKAALSKKNDMLFTELDKFKESFFGNLLLSDNKRTNKTKLLKELCVKYPTVIAKNVTFREQIEFSKSMIEFTLCLHKILSRVDKVYTN